MFSNLKHKCPKLRSILPSLILGMVLLLVLHQCLYGMIKDFKHRNNQNSTVNLPWWDGGDCSNKTPIFEDQVVDGHCGLRASNLGPGQKIISMNVYGKVSGYFIGIEENLHIIKQVYPGYILRFYMDPREYKNFLCPLLMKNDHLYVCDIRNLPSGIGNITSVQKSSWRFSAMGDPHVDIVLFRDSDSRIIEREVSAVNEWLLSKTTMHVMRDWPRNIGNFRIIAGTWGLRTDLGKMHSNNIDMKRMLNIIRERMFLYLSGKKRYGEDQIALRENVWNVLRNDVVIHASFFCKQYPESWPFPSQRNGTRLNVGNRRYRSANDNDFRKIPDMTCPWECRPPNHKDWIYC